MLTNYYSFINTYKIPKKLMFLSSWLFRKYAVNNRRMMMLFTRFYLVLFTQVVSLKFINFSISAISDSFSWICIALYCLFPNIITYIYFLKMDYLVTSVSRLIFKMIRILKKKSDGGRCFFSRFEIKYQVFCWINSRKLV